MTQKSYARQQREAAKKEMDKQNVVSPYIELENLFQTQIKLFPRYYEMAQIISNPQVSQYLKDAQRTLNRMRTLSVDVNELFKKTHEVHKRHAGRTTEPSKMNEDEHFDCIMLHQEYAMFFNVHSQTIVPIMLELDEDLAYALRRKTDVENALNSATQLPATTLPGAVAEGTIPTHWPAAEAVATPAQGAGAATMDAYDKL